jgi:hypothetical protein
MAFMKMFWGVRCSPGRDKRVLIRRDGTINQKDLEKLTMDELFYIYKKCCTGRKRDALIGLILAEGKEND